MFEKRENQMNTIVIVVMGGGPSFRTSALAVQRQLGISPQWRVGFPPDGSGASHPARSAGNVGSWKVI